MSRPAAAALVAALLTAAAPFARSADADGTLISGTVLTAEPASDPFAGGGGAGSLVIVDKSGHTESYTALGTTRLTRDGEKIAFERVLVGDLVVKAVFAPKTRLLTDLDLKSAPAPIPWKPAAPETAKTGEVSAKIHAPAAFKFKGKVSFADVIRGELWVRPAKGRARKFAVAETTVVLRERAGAPAQEADFKTLLPGDAVEVRSRDGRIADQIRVRASAR